MRALPHRGCAVHTAQAWGPPREKNLVDKALTGEDKTLGPKLYGGRGGGQRFFFSVPPKKALPPLFSTNTNSPPNSFDAGGEAPDPPACRTSCLPCSAATMGGSEERAPWCSPVASLLAMATPAHDASGICAAKDAAGMGKASRRDADDDDAGTLHLACDAPAARAAAERARCPTMPVLHTPRAPTPPLRCHHEHRPR